MGKKEPTVLFRVRFGFFDDKGSVLFGSEYFKKLGSCSVRVV